MALLEVIQLVIAVLQRPTMRLGFAAIEGGPCLLPVFDEAQSTAWRAELIALVLDACVVVTVAACPAELPARLKELLLDLG